MDDRMTPESTDDLDGLFVKLKGWFNEDYEKQAEWRESASEDFAFVAGDQWTEEDKQRLRDQMRPIITMNRIDPIIDSVSGSEVANRQEVRYLPREEGDVQVNEVLTSAAQWFRDQCDAEDEESDAFRDTLICGMGWTETRLDYETSPDGEPRIERVDPLEMVWDAASRKRNLTDARRVFHVRKLSLDDAKALIGGEFEDEDYNAAWVKGHADASVTTIDPSDRYGARTEADDDKASSGEKRVTLVRVQWWEREPVYRVLLPTPDGRQSIQVLNAQEYQEYQQRAKMAGAQPRVVPGSRRVYRQAYLGSRVLEAGPAPCKEHFSFNCITGKRHRNQNSWYGLVRGMKDPQLWANKFFSQILHIINTSAKGGVMAERGAFDDDKKAEETWARQDAITWLKPGALSGQNSRVEPKPQTGMPAAMANMMEFAISSIRDVSGVSIEALGMREANQAASLEYQRKQSSMTILQPMFDSLRRYRKMQGRQMLYLIQHYLSDGRLIRIVGKDQEQYVPLTKQPDSAEYDIIVDDAPTSPNQKEATWAMLQQILPVVGKILPPQTWIALLEFSPLPTSAQAKIKQSIEPPKGPDGQPIPPPEPPEVQKAKMEMELAAQRQQADLALKQHAQQADFSMQQAKAAQDMEIEKVRLANSIAMERERMQNEMAIAQERAQQEMAIKAMSARMSAENDAIRAQNEARQPARN